MSKKILIPLAEGCEELEAVTLIDLLRRASFDVITASLKDQKEVICSRNTRLVADTTLAAVMDDKFDLIVLPGGLPGADYLNNDERLHALLKKTHEQGGYVGAICAAPRVLVSANIGLEKLTAYPGSLDHLDTAQRSRLNLLDEVVVKDGTIVTSRGPGTAMDFALELIEILAGKDARERVEVPLVRP